MWTFQTIRDQAAEMFRGKMQKSPSNPDNKNMFRPYSNSAMNNVVTPESIPQFTLPPMLSYATQKSSDDELIEPVCLQDKKESPGTESNISSSNNSSWSLRSLVKGGSKKQLEATLSNKAVVKPQKRFGTEENQSKKGSKQSIHSTPGMSLQHLLSNKAGFSTLTESPHTRRKESLFLTPGDVDKNHNDVHRGYHENTHVARATIKSPATSPYTARIQKKHLQSPKYSNNNSMRGSSWKDSPALSIDEDSVSRLEKTDNHLIRRHSLGTVEDKCNISFSKSENTMAKLQKSAGGGVDKKQCNNKGIKCEHEGGLSPIIHVCVSYLPVHKRLNMSIVRGENFTEGSTISFKVHLLPKRDRGQKSEYVKISSSSPDFKQRLTFDSVYEDDIPHSSLKILCREKHHKIRHSGVIREVILALSDINVRSSSPHRLVLHLPNADDTPHLQLSLCYHAMLGCLTVEVIAARNVRKGTMGKQPDCFVMLMEKLSDEKTVKKQTRTICRTQDPVFHESFLFSMYADGQSPGMLTASLYSKEKGGTLLGEVTIGETAHDSSGRSQWAQALHKEGEPVTVWHVLRTVTKKTD